jgi:hypothetical protein
LTVTSGEPPCPLDELVAAAPPPPAAPLELELELVVGEPPEEQAKTKVPRVMAKGREGRMGDT